MNYKSGRIDRVLNKVTDQFYIGSTGSPLPTCMAQLRKTSLTSTDPLYKRMRAEGPNPFYIQLIEELPRSSKDHVISKEQALARQLGATLNFFGKQNHKSEPNTQSAPKTPEHYDRTEDSDVQEEHSDDIPTNKPYFNDLDGFNKLSGFLTDAELNAMRDHYDSVIGLRRFYFTTKLISTTKGN